MKMPIVWHSLQVALLPLVAALPLAAMAQSAIQHATKPYGAVQAVAVNPVRVETATITVAKEALINKPVVAATNSAVEPKVSDVKTWTILTSDVRLATTLDRWTKQEGYKLIWDAQQHVLLSTSDSFVGTFEESLTRVLSSPAIRQSAYPLEACIYLNNPPVVRITRLGEQAQECPFK